LLKLSSELKQELFGEGRPKGYLGWNIVGSDFYFVDEDVIRMVEIE